MPIASLDLGALLQERARDDEPKGQQFAPEMEAMLAREFFDDYTNPPTLEPGDLVQVIDKFAELYSGLKNGKIAVVCEVLAEPILSAGFEDGQKQVQRQNVIIGYRVSGRDGFVWVTFAAPDWHLKKYDGPVFDPSDGEHAHEEV